MKILYLILTLLVFTATSQQVNAQQLNTHETQVLKKYLDKNLLRMFAASKVKAEQNAQRDFSFSTLSDSIYTFSKFNQADNYGPGLNYYFTYEVVGNNAIITAIDIKILDASLPIDNIRAVPTYDSQQRISKITMTAVFLGLPLNILNYYYKYDSKGNTTSIVIESPGILGGETTNEGDSVQFTYGTGNRVIAYNLYTLVEEEWTFATGVSDVTYGTNGNVSGITQWISSTDSVAPVPVPFIRLRNIEWLNNQMPSNIMNPLDPGDSFESELIGIELATADESYKSEPVEYIQETYIGDVWYDSTIVRTYEETGNTFTVLDSYYDTGDFIYTEMTEYTYDGELLIREEILFDLGSGDPVPLDKIEYEYNDYDVLSKEETFTFDQGLWISNSVSTFDVVVVDNELVEYTETYIIGAEYESYKTVFFPSDILGTSVNEAVLDDQTVKIFPTIVANHLTINFPQHDFVKNVDIMVLDLNGSVLRSERYDVALQNLEFNISSLLSGIYVLNVRMPEGIRTVRFVKQ